MNAHVFAYGSLMFPEVWARVVRGSYRSTRAELRDCARYGVANETYPGLIEEHGSSVSGVVYFDVDARDLAALDLFEGEDYRRVGVRVQPNGMAPCDAQAYLYLPRERLTGTIWRPEAFAMQGFIDTYCRVRLGDDHGGDQGDHCGEAS